MNIEPTTCKNCYEEAPVCGTCGLCEDCHDHPFEAMPFEPFEPPPPGPGDGPPYDHATATGMYDRGDVPE